MADHLRARASEASTPPVLILAPPRFVGPLGVIRTLRPLGVRVYVCATRERSLAAASRWCAGTFPIGDEGRPGQNLEACLAELEQAGRRLGRGTVLLAGSDEWAVFVARHAERLAETFVFPRQELGLVEALASKEGMHDLAAAHGVPTPRVTRPRTLEEAESMAGELQYPVMLKPVESRPGRQSVSLATDRDSFLRTMRETEEPGNLLCQEYIPGSDADVWIFNGYFDAASRSLAPFTGRKLRQHPAHMGLCSLGECAQNAEVIAVTERFLAEVGYRGIVDIGYRWDRRDSSYKVLDINPRLGGAFRLFVDRNGLDVVRACYLDLTGRPVPAMAPWEGRRWMLEAADLIAFKHYRRDSALTVRGWIKSLHGLEEGATFSLSDPLPFVTAMLTVASDTLGARWRRVRQRLVRREPVRDRVAAVAATERAR